jgi:hypothetical protein
MPDSAPSSKRRLWLRIGFASMILVGLYFAPLFRIVSLEGARQRQTLGAFDFEGFVESFWNDRLVQARAQAVDAGQLLGAMRHDPTAAAHRYGRQLGLSSTSSYWLSGTGRITAVTPAAVAIALDEDTATTDLLIETGPIFGNAIRDGSGMLDVSEFPNSQDFNALSAAINRRVEESVFPALRAGAVVGAQLRFLGAAEVTDPATDLQPLRLIPVLIEFP